MQFVHKKKVLTYAITWMPLENIMLSERSQSQKAICCMNICELFRIRKYTETESKLLVN